MQTSTIDATAYQASHIKRRRATKVEMEERRDALLAIVAEQKPMTVRQVFYQATVRGLIEKTEAGYAKVQNLLAVMRREGELPYAWLADNTRWMRKPRTYDGLANAIEHWARSYRRSLWSDADSYVEIWLEKDALAGVLVDVTIEYDVPLMVSRGYASLSFLHNAADTIASLHRPAFIYHLGDYDPSGVNAAEKIEQTLRELAPDAEIHFQRVAVTPEQIELWNLASRPTKTSDTRSKSWMGGDSVELDAISPADLRDLVEDCITRHLDSDQLETLQVAEKSEREVLRHFAGRFCEEAAG
jgi:hypothetical protein